jgi:hypothetical protein
MHYCGWIGGIDPNAYPCVLPPGPPCHSDVPAEVPYPFSWVCVLSLVQSSLKVCTDLFIGLSNQVR